MSQVDTAINASIVPMGENTGIPGALDFPLAASEDAGKGQYLTLNPSTGMASLADDNTPHQIAAGFVHPDEQTTLNTTAGQAIARVSQRWAEHKNPSTIASDGFSAADVGAPWWIVDGNTPGKLSHTSTKNRSLGGLVIGLIKQGSTAIRHWGGPIAQAIARGVLVATDFPFGWYTIADAAASTTTAERAIPSSKVHGLVTRVEFVGAAVAADNTDYVTITIAKRSDADAYAAATTVATYDSRTANNGAISAFTPAAFTLAAAAALSKLETTIYTITVAKGGSGKTLTGEILINGKVI